MEFVIADGIEGLIFDCDGTLVDNMPLHFKSWKKAFDAFDRELTWGFMEETSGMTFSATVNLYNERFGCDLDYLEIMRLKDENYHNFADEIEPVHSVCDVVRKYAGKMAMSVVSGSRGKNVHRCLRMVEVDSLFDIVLTADDPYPGKPAPDLFLEAAGRMGIAPEVCVVFEDGEAGMVGARAAGMQVIDVRDIVQRQREMKAE